MALCGAGGNIVIADTIQDVLEQCEAYGTYEPEYYEKQIHQVPDAKVVDRNEFILGRCKDRTLMSIGASGSLQDAIYKVCKKCYGIDIDPPPVPREHFVVMDLDGPRHTIPKWPGVEFVLCGEVLEHLANPGRLLAQLKDYGLPVIITVPNAHSESSRQMLVKKGIENVNREHVAWYSYRTLLTLVERYGFEVEDFFWYHGRPLTAEGLIFVVR